MQRRNFTPALLVAGWSAGIPVRAAGFSQSDAASAIRSALERGAISAVALLGKPDGFMANPRVRIALPGHLQSAAGMLKMIGLEKQLDELVLAMNRAAEAAVPQAKTLLVQTARSISVDDAVAIVRGSDTSVTDYFAARTRVPLGEQLQPIVAKATEKVSLADKFNAIAGKAAQVGLIKGEDSNLQRYVTSRSLDGLYLIIGDEERKIRRDPVGTGSAILRKVFGG